MDDCYIAGLLHDLGKPILAANFPERYGRAQALAQERKVPRGEAEKEIFGVTHAEVGAYLIGLWGLPDPVVEGLAFHHSPNQWLRGGFTPLLTVHVANALEHWGNRTGGEEGEPPIDLDSLSIHGLIERLSVWKEAGKKILQRGELNEG